MTLLRSRFVRLALAMALLPTLVVAVVATVGLARLDRQLTRAYDLRLGDEIAALSEAFAREGLPGLDRMISARRAMHPSERDPVIYAVLENGAPLSVGDHSLRGDPSGFVEVDGHRLRETPLSPTTDLIVASATTERRAALRDARRDAILAVLACLLLGLLLGALSARRFAARLDRMNRTIDRVAEGEVGLRIPPDGSSDELSVLGAHVNAMLDRVNRLVATRKTVSDQLAHEIRTPLSKLDKALLDMPNTPDVERARADVRRCVAMLDGLLDVSALEAQFGDRAGFSVVDLSERARDLCEFYDALAEDAGVSLVCDCDAPARMRGNADQLDRLIANLLSNAIKFSPDGGTVRLRSWVENGRVGLSVRDQGPGVDPDVREDIFQPFFRRAGSVRGHGLGLALARAVAERHEGTITVSDAAPGARFDFTTKAFT